MTHAMHDPTKDNQVKLKFQIEPDEDGYPPFRVESVWVTPLPDGTYQVDNIPFFAYDAADGDVVTGQEIDGELFFDHLVRPSGNSVVRIIVNDEASIPAVRAQLTALGCDTEWWGKLVTINVPADVPYDPVYQFLDAGETAGRWGFEESVLKHPLAESP